MGVCGGSGISLSHNLKVAGSNPAPATKYQTLTRPRISGALPCQQIVNKTGRELPSACAKTRTIMDRLQSAGMDPASLRPRRGLQLLQPPTPPHLQTHPSNLPRRGIRRMASRSPGRAIKARSLGPACSPHVDATAPNREITGRNAMQS